MTDNRQASPVPGQWDPADPRDATAEAFRLGMIRLLVDADKATIYRDLSPQDQIGSFIAGTMTGLFDVCFARVDQAGRDGMTKTIADYLPYARAQAEQSLDRKTTADPDGR